MTRSALDVVLVLPGGGYRVHAPHEAEPIVEWLGTQGWPAKIVNYPLRTAHPAPLRAVSRAVARERAGGARRVGVIGFSAGGHLAGLSALAPGLEPDERPDFAILGYPVVSMIDGPHTNSRAVLLGDDAGSSDNALAQSLSLETLVRPDSPPMFVWHTAEDGVVPVRHSYLLGQALAAARVPHELHVFPGDIHGVALAADTDAAGWTSLCADWLARLPVTLR
ncbi:alpha/beta hydrolase [Kineosporia babensis]|uniref:Alpha/beta hydrolase n=1 Tax=Kineosporia babensis TaxID=499548 RepID=A0A9X1N8Y0_9ACTN|nr:alpha/beta hydrolase [Kineosporia babensis]